MYRWITFTFLILSSTQLFAFDIYLIRHFEKQTDTLDPSLTATGQARAQSLAKYFKDQPLAVVFSTPYKRTLETASLVAESKGLLVTQYSAHDLSAFAKSLSEYNQPVLVVGHSNTTPTLIQALGGPEFTIDEDEYAVLYHIYKKEGEVLMQSDYIKVTHHAYKL